MSPTDDRDKTAAPSEPRGKTHYVILRRVKLEPTDEIAWEQIGGCQAHNRGEALRTALGSDEPENGAMFQVVPARSFKAITVSVVTPPPEVKFDGLD